MSTITNNTYDDDDDKPALPWPHINNPDDERGLETRRNRHVFFVLYIIYTYVAKFKPDRAIRLVKVAPSGPAVIASV